MKEAFNTIIGTLLTTFIFLVGKIDIAIISLICVMTLDYITGIIVAYYKKKLNSKVGFRGILKKVLYLIIVMLSVIIDRLLGESNVIRTFVIYYFVANDGLSIIENVGKLGIKLPKRLHDALEQLKGE